MEDQSPFISSSYPESHPSAEPRDEDRKPWEDQEVLDLTGGAGGFRPDLFRRGEAEEEDDKPSYSDSLEPSPEEEEPSSISEQPIIAPPVLPSAPLEEEEEERPPVPRRAPTGSVDENLFPLPAASAPLMHSSADKVLDMQQPYSTMLAGQEELASVLLESASSPPSMSPLSADSSKEQVVSVAFHANLTAPEALQEPVSDLHGVSRTVGDTAFSVKLGNEVEPDYSEVSYHKGSSSLGQIKEDVIFSEKGYVVEHPTSQQETVSEDHTQLYAQSAKEMFSGMLKAVGPPHEEFSEIKEALEEQYVDFKPFVKSYEGGYEASTKKFESDIYSLNVEAVKRPEQKYEEDNEIDLSDDISPITPEGPESSEYEMFVSLEKSLYPTTVESQGLGNKTDEKKMEEVEAKTTSLESALNLTSVNPFFEHVDRQGDYVTTHDVMGGDLSHGPTKSEGLTPDIVQEAYESEIHDIGIPILGYEPKMDLVQTAAKAVQENAAKSDNVTPTSQTPALFEGTDSVSSPVLPDIVMEAPLTSGSVGLEASVFHPDVSPVSSAPAVSEEKIKFQSEKPPSYEEAVSKSGTQDQDKAAKRVEIKEESPSQEPEAPYISIACDLIKETIPTESAPDFSKAMKDEFESQFSQHFDDSSSESEHSEPSYKHWEPEVVSRKVCDSVTSVKTQSISPEKELKGDLLFKESSPNKSYLHSFQVQSNTSQNPSDFIGKSSVTEVFKSPDKPLQMEEFSVGIQSGKTPSPKYSPITETADSEKSSPISFMEDAIRTSDDVHVEMVQKAKLPDKPINVPSFGKKEDLYSALYQDPMHAKAEQFQDTDKSNEYAKAVDLTTRDDSSNAKDAKLPPPPKEDAPAVSSTKVKQESKDLAITAPVLTPALKNSVVDLLYWRDIKKSGAVFGASLFLLLSLTVFSIVSVIAYIALALLSVTISFRIYKGVLQAIQKSDEGHPFRSCLDCNVGVSEDLVKKYSDVALNHINCTIKELRRLFLVEDLVDSLKFAVLMWVFTYIGALFNGLTLLILALISLFSIPVIYERHQTQIDHYLALVNKNVKNITDLVLAKVPGLKRKTE
ncbi:reticulon-4 isoform X1 [Pelobates fuscus]|uniref:reticulon-4 isoform X1 n=1 Tax=Pelobates fuscus TaxID=191477 RepID=UPI002FE4DB91